MIYTNRRKPILSSRASLIFLFLFSFLSSFNASAQDPPTYKSHVCPNTTTFSRNSTFSNNLNFLFSLLSSPSISYSTGFQNVTVGEPPDSVTGLFNCSKEVSPEVCRSCVAFAVKDTLVRCPNRREVTLLYDECTLRYSIFIISSQDPTYIYHICPNTTTFSRNSTYFVNLRTLLSSLSSRNASYSTGFQNVTVGKPPDRVTGLFNCRGDVSPELCRSCVIFAVNETLNRCPNEREVTLYYDECMLRYSNGNILSTLSTGGGVIMWNTRNVTSNQLDQFRTLVASTMSQAATEASSNSRKFDARKANFTAFQNVYGLVQCTPDLTRQDCLSCLQQSINQLPNDKIGGRFMMQSCNSRYELYAFYSEPDIRTPPPPPPRPAVSIPSS